MPRPPILWLVPWLLLAGLLQATSAAAGPAVRVTRQSPVVVETDSGQGVTLTFRVENLTDTPRTLLTHVVLPTDWRVLFSSPSLDIAPASVAIEFIVVSAPRAATADDYRVVFEAREKADAAPATAEATVRVRVQRRLTLTWADTPEYVAPGESFTAHLMLMNAGNLPSSWTLALRRADGTAVVPSAPTSSGVLAPGASAQMNVEVRTNAHVTRMTQDSISAAVSAADTAPAEANFAFATVPRDERATAPRDQMPVSFALRAGSNRDPGFGSLVGAGFIDRAHTTSIDFGSLSGEQSDPLMRELDRRYFSLTSPHMQVMAGDQTWSLSQLTESGRYGYGGGVRGDSARLFGGAFVDTGRRQTPEASQTGAFFGVKTGRATTVSVQYLARFSDTIHSARAAELGSLKATFAPTGPWRSEIEVGGGRSNAGNGRAASGELAFSDRRLSFNLRRVQATPLYPMFDRTGLLNSASVTVQPVGRQFSFGGAFNGTKQVPDVLFLTGAPSRQRFTQANAGWGAWFRVEATRSQWTGAGSPWTDGWRRESVNAHGTVPMGVVSVTPGIERGRQSSPSSPSAVPFTRLSLQADVPLGRRGSAFVRADDERRTQTAADDLVTHTLLVGGNVRPFAGTLFSFQATNSSNDAPWLQGTRLINLVLDQTLPWSHHLVMTYRRIESSSAYLPSSEAWRVDYVIPVRIPLRSPLGVGGLAVRLRRGDTGKAVVHARVSVAGRSLLSNDSGDVDFKDLPAGEYFVTVASPLLGPGWAFAPGATIHAVVVSGRTAHVEASLVRTSAIEGSIRRFDTTAFANPRGLVDAAGLADVTIELSSDAGDVRALTTDGEGRFRVCELLPGTWHVRVASSVDRPFYRLEARELTFVLRPGETATVQFKLVPKSMMGGGLEDHGWVSGGGAR